MTTPTPHDPPPPEYEAQPPAHDALAPSRSRAWLVPAGLAVALVALVGGLALGRATAGTARVTDEISIGFARDMSTHHAQAVRMSEVAHRRSPDPTLNFMAFDILSTQQGQLGMMSGWLDLWEQPQSGTGKPMGWMGHSGPMPGMASERELRALDTVPVPAMEEQWLRLMVRHHRGAIAMADAAATGADSPDVALLAKGISAAQQSEINALQGLLRERGLRPEPDEAAGAHGDGHGGPPAS